MSVRDKNECSIDGAAALEPDDLAESIGGTLYIRIVLSSDREAQFVTALGRSSGRLGRPRAKNQDKVFKSQSTQRAPPDNTATGSNSAPSSTNSSSRTGPSERNMAIGRNSTERSGQAAPSARRGSSGGRPGKPKLEVA